MTHPGAIPANESENIRPIVTAGLAKDVDKKLLIWEMVSKMEPQITWHYNKVGKLKKENFDQTDAYTAVLGYMKSKEIW